MPELCKFNRVGTLNEWHCPVCNFFAFTDALPERVCDLKPINVDPRIKVSKSRRSTAVPQTPRDPWDSENQYLKVIQPCPHRGEIVETMLPCLQCGSKDQVYNVYACDKHEKCTLGNRRVSGSPEMQTCYNCPDGPPLVLPAKPTETPPSRPPQTPTVAVVIISHNYGRFLADALDSVLSQTHPASEIVVVDDSSTDDTPAVAMSYTSKRVRYLRIDARDVNQGREAGFLTTSAECLVFLDADDMLPPEYLATGLPLFDDPLVSLVYGDHQQFGTHTDLVVWPVVPDQSVHWENFIHSASLVRRAALVSADAFRGLPDQTACGHHNDWALWRRVLTNGRKAVKQSTPLLYRRHDKNWLAEGRKTATTYYDRAALSIEPLTVFLCLSGRLSATDDVLSWLDRQTRDHRLCHLVILDTSQDPLFSRRVRQWMATCDYQDVRMFSKAVGFSGLADADRVNDLGVRQSVNDAMHRIYDNLVNCTTEYILTLEDDITPPDDAIDRLLRHMGGDVFSVTSPYRSRFKGWSILARPGNGVPYELIHQRQYGLQPAYGNGFGCTVLRRSVLSRIGLLPRNGIQEYDVTLYDRLAETYWKALADWDCCSIHAGLPPEDPPIMA